MGIIPWREPRTRGWLEQGMANSVLNHEKEPAEMAEHRDLRLQDLQEWRQLYKALLARLATWPRASSLMIKLHWMRGTSTMVQKRAAPPGENGYADT